MNGERLSTSNDSRSFIVAYNGNDVILSGAQDVYTDGIINGGDAIIVRSNSGSLARSPEGASLR